jgi:GH25 family lysozyme M1 (1,4-beta-N-acetylmuramidase)
MRIAPILVAAATLAAPLSAAAAPVAAHAEDPKTTTDIRCIIVGGALAQSDDPELQSLGRASLFYFMGRLEGRGDMDNIDARIVDVAAKMTSDDIKTQSQTCGAMFTAATQGLQQLSDAFKQHFNTPPAAGAAPAAPPK